MEVMDRTQQLEEELAQTKHALHCAESLLSLIDGHFYSKDADGVILNCNLQQARSAGYESVEQFIGKTDYDYLSQQDADRVRALDKQVMQTRQTLTKEEVGYLPNGQQHVFLSTKAPLYDITRQYVIGIIGISIDITQQKKSIQLAEEAKEYYEYIISQIPGHVYWVDTNNIYLGCNDEQAVDANLSSRKEIVGKTLTDMLSIEYATELDKINSEVMRTGIPYTVEEKCHFPTVGNSIWFSKKVPLYDSKRNIIGMLGVSINITDRKKAEKLLVKNAKLKYKQEETQRYANRMKVIAANISHEMRTPLAGIKLTTQVIQQSFRKLTQGYQMAVNSNLVDDALTNEQLQTFKELLSKAVTQVDRANTMISIQLNNIRRSHADTKNFSTYSIKTIIDEALSHYPFKSDEKDITETNLKYDFLIKGDRILLQHVLWNLIKNALHCIENEDKGRIHIWLEHNKAFNILYFKDTAKGMKQQEVELIFNEFYSGKPDGTGLGLTFCQSVMQALGGQIKCRSKLGEFTEFALLFPKVE